MSARDDYQHLWWHAGHHVKTGLGTDAERALAEIDRLRAEVERLEYEVCFGVGGDGKVES